MAVAGDEAVLGLMRHLARNHGDALDAGVPEAEPEPGSELCAEEAWQHACCHALLLLLGLVLLLEAPHPVMSYILHPI